MRLFTGTNHCIAQVHCGACRDLKGGRKWRKALHKTFLLPDDKVDFDCPVGFPWGFIPPNLPKPLNKQRCPHFRKTCCGEPNLCGLTGAAIDPGACEKCELLEHHGLSVTK